MISLFNQRVLYDDNGTLTDISLKVNNYRTGTESFSMVAAEDAIYIGQPLPFGNRHINLGASVNANAATLSVEYWDGTQWVPALDVIDETGAQPFAQSGYISWKVDRDDSGWQWEEKSKDITELASGPQIYDMYWARIKTSADLQAVDLNFLGHFFNNDDELFSWYPALNNYQLFDAFEPTQASGTKTDWNEQSLMAAEYIINRMMGEGIAITGGQVLDTRKLGNAGIHKTAHIIFSAMGDGYEKDAAIAGNAFEKAFNLKNFGVDADGDGHVDSTERLKTDSIVGR